MGALEDTQYILQGARVTVMPVGSLLCAIVQMPLIATGSLPAVALHAIKSFLQHTL